jgi:hypothetical protein
MLLFKYVSPDAATKVFGQDNELAIRFGLPKSYNDPYELFLEPDAPLEDEAERAFYKYFLGEITEAPVACFSKRPDSIVMWAHYARDSAGICLALDEDELVDQFPLAHVGDIAYSDVPAKISSDVIRFAFTTGKRRHTYALLRVGHRAAYFSKRTEWQYEAERRVVVTPDAVEDREGALIGRINPKALRHIIVGPKVDTATKRLCLERAKAWGTSLVELRIGSGTFSPFFVDADKSTASWADGNFRTIVKVCADCGEPIPLLKSGKCQWCDIAKEDVDAAGRRSLLTLLLAQGIDKGIPFEFDGMEVRGHLTNKAKRQSMDAKGKSSF